MKFPSDFPNEAQAAVLTEQVRAAQALDKAMGRMPPPGYSVAQQAATVSMEYILRIVSVFGHQACELGKKGTWGVLTVNDATREFLRLLCSDTRIEYPQLKLPDMLSEYGYIKPEVWGAVKSSFRWKKFERELLAVAELQSGITQPAKDATATVGANAPPSPPLAINIGVSDDLGERLRDENGADAKPTDDEEVARRAKLYAEYRDATGKPSNRSVYEGDNVPIHKPQFYAYLDGRLKSSSSTFANFEHFLREKKPPTPKKPRH
jgi:hypothetical protein